jgi:hypothetical protein
MCINARIVNKILANKIQQCIKETVHHDQVEFILGMKGWFNICKSTNTIHHTSKMKGKNHKVISINTEKTLINFNIPAMYSGSPSTL